jgi:hypothetical protein
MDLLQLCFRLLGWQVNLQFTSSYERLLPATTTDFRSAKRITLAQQPVYYQGFENQTGFLPDLSILDLLFNLGPGSLAYLRSCSF